MKPSEIIDHIYENQMLFGNDDNLAPIWGRLKAVVQYLDEQAELLETHTVKEEDNMVRCEHGLIAGDECLCEIEKEEPTTQEKKCCDESCDDCRKHGFHSLDCPTRNQEKLQTYFYKVTCGRCEKSIKLKHSCGRV